MSDCWLYIGAYGFLDRNNFTNDADFEYSFDRVLETYNQHDIGFNLFPLEDLAERTVDAICNL